MNLNNFFKLVGGKISDIKIIKKEDCLEAVKQNGNALPYVKEQSEAICLEAVKQDGNALPYVDIRVFGKSTERKE